MYDQPYESRRGPRYDDILRKQVGQFGWYQGLVTLSLSLVSVPLAFSSLDLGFVMAAPQHWCYLPEMEQLQQGANASLLEQMKVELSLQKQAVGQSICVTHYLEYSNYSWLGSNRSLSDVVNTSEIQKTACSRWKSDTTLYGETVASELTCSRQWLVPFAPAVLALGQAVGAVLCGGLADIVGRRPVCLSSLLLHVLVRLASAFSSSYALFLVLRFAMALTAAGVLVSVKVLPN